VESYDRDVRFAHGTLGAHRHVCAFFNSPDEEQRVLAPFVKEGLSLGEKSIHIVDPTKIDDYLRRLRHSDIPVDALVESGQLQVVPWDDAHIRGGRFEQDAMLSWVDEILTANTAAYPGSRIVAHMEWALLDIPGVEDLLEYEARVNRVLAKHDAPVICAYDASRFGANVALDIMRTHPLVIIGGVLQENPFYVPPDELLIEIREARSRRLPAARTRSAVSSTA
jgi:DcmR-like sensory protein